MVGLPRQRTSERTPHLGRPVVAPYRAAALRHIPVGVELASCSSAGDPWCAIQTLPAEVASPLSQGDKMTELARRRVL